ncbi:MAG: hypothetical protein GX318_01870 [Clostridia bacterium]|nr:hypothetical protein [Clostridia bacterium]
MPSQENQEQQEKTRRFGRKWFILALAAFLAVGMAGGWYLFSTFSNSRGYEAALPSPSVEKTHQVTLETFTVNLGDMGFRRYVRTDITLECFTKGTLKEIDQKEYQIRDQVITFLNQKKVADFDSKEKFERIRIELLETINGILSPENQVRAIYFNTFIIQ